MKHKPDPVVLIREAQILQRPRPVPLRRGPPVVDSRGVLAARDAVARGVAGRAVGGAGHFRTSGMISSHMIVSSTRSLGAVGSMSTTS